MGTWIIYLSSCLSLCFLFVLIKFLNKLWWTPIRIQSAMRSQGIKGRPYKFLHGSTKEIIKMKNEVSSSPMEISHHVFTLIQPHIYSWKRLYGNNFVYWFGSLARMVVTEPELIKEILDNKNGAYPKQVVQGYWKKLVGDGLGASRGEKWVKQRKLANYAFHGESLKAMVPEMIASVEMMLERWRKHEGKEIEVFQEFKVLTSDIISRTAFGSSYLEGQRIFDMLTKMILIVSRNAYKIRIPGLRNFLKTDDDIESNKLEEGIRNSIKQMIRKREEKIATGEVEGYSDYLGLLMKAYSDNDKTISISALDDLIDVCKTFYFAGHETTMSSLTWTILLLAIHTDWQEKARIEVLELIGQQSPSAESITKFKTINMIVYESLRLYPAAPHVIRVVSQKVKLGNLILPENIEVFISILAAHHDPQIWGEDVHLFKPERFAEGVSKATNNNPGAYLPFGLGLRHCVGSNFALAETKIVLSMILQRYKFVLSPSYIHSPAARVTLYPQQGVKVMLQAL